MGETGITMVLVIVIEPYLRDKLAYTYHEFLHLPKYAPLLSTSYSNDS